MIELKSVEDCIRLARANGMPPMLAEAIGAGRLAAAGGRRYGIVGLEGPADARAPVGLGGRRWPALVGPDGRLGEGGGLDRMGLWNLILFEDGAGDQAALLSRCEEEPYLVAWPAGKLVGESELERVAAAILGNGLGGCALRIPAGLGGFAATAFVPRPEPAIAAAAGLLGPGRGPRQERAH